jgi:hypothetical protein
MNSKTSKKVAAALAAGAVTVAGSGVAFAYWTSTGNGTGTAAATAGAVNTLTFTQTALDGMYPGDSAQTLTVAVKNTGDQSVYISTVKAYLTVVKNSGNTAVGNCNAGDFKLGGVVNAADADSAVEMTWTDEDLAKDEVHNATSTVQFNNTAENQDACKGAAVTVHYLAS